MSVLSAGSWREQAEGVGAQASGTPGHMRHTVSSTDVRPSKAAAESDSPWACVACRASGRAVAEPEGPIPVRVFVHLPLERCRFQRPSDKARLPTTPGTLSCRLCSPALVRLGRNHH